MELLCLTCKACKTVLLRLVRRAASIVASTATTTCFLAPEMRIEGLANTKHQLNSALEVVGV
jgi:hypothetical protein